MARAINLLKIGDLAASLKVDSLSKQCKQRKWKIHKDISSAALHPSSPQEETRDSVK